MRLIFLRLLFIKDGLLNMIMIYSLMKILAYVQLKNRLFKKSKITIINCYFNEL